MTKKQIIQYLIDCNGHSKNDLYNLTKEELEEYVTDWTECKQYNC